MLDTFFSFSPFNLVNIQYLHTRMPGLSVLIGIRLKSIAFVHRNAGRSHNVAFNSTTFSVRLRTTLPIFVFILKNRIFPSHNNYSSRLPLFFLVGRVGSGQARSVALWHVGVKMNSNYQRLDCLMEHNYFLQRPKRRNCQCQQNLMYLKNKSKNEKQI